uniref:Glycine-rich cell wall structural protein-like n=1 Tax=Steinernema glaseri TaxID=37863 RepID=A0A1I7ZBC4_9BILA
MQRLCLLVLPLIGFVSTDSGEFDPQVRERRDSIMGFVCRRKSDLSFCKPQVFKPVKKPLYIPPDIPHATRAPFTEGNRASTFRPRAGRVHTTSDWADENSWNIQPQRQTRPRPQTRPQTPDIGLGNPTWNANPGFDRSVQGSGQSNNNIGIGSGVNAGPVGVNGGLGLQIPGLGNSGAGSGVPTGSGGGSGGIGVNSGVGVGPVGVSSGLGIGAPGIGGLGGGGLGGGRGLFGIGSGVGVSAPFIGPIGVSSGFGIG